jgi:signal transduction histidine kinase
MVKYRTLNYRDIVNEKTERNESLSLLAGGIAYDINIKLASILGNIEILQIYAKKEDRLLARLANAEKAVAQAKDLTQQLLDLSNNDTPRKMPA